MCKVWPDNFCSIFAPMLYSLPNPGYIRGQFTFVEGCLPLGGRSQYDEIEFKVLESKFNSFLSSVCFDRLSTKYTKFKV